MEELKLYSVSDDYVEWLRKEFPNVYSNKINSRTHTGKYLGVVLQIGEYHYYVPMSSPKDSDYHYDEMNGYDFDLFFSGTEYDFQKLNQAFAQAGVTQQNHDAHLY